MEYKLHSSYCMPIVYTTRLEDMAILRKRLSNLAFKYVINAITDESKPNYICPLKRRIDSIKSKHANPEKVQFNQLILKRNHNSKNKQGIVFIPDITKFRKKQKLHHKIAREYKVTNNLINTAVKKSNKVIKSETTVKQRELLSMCKPLQIVLRDINKCQIKVDNKINQVRLISSDDDNVEDNESETIFSDVDTTQYHIIKNINVFKDRLNEYDIKSSVILIYNLFLNAVDIYQIGKMYNVTYFLRVRYPEIKKKNAIKCKSIFNIIVCCWKNRHSYISLLRSYKQYSDIVKCMYIEHPCKELNCKCCCTNAEKNCAIDHFKDQSDNNSICDLIDVVSKSLLANPVSSQHDVKQSFHSKTYNFIKAALEFPLLFKKKEKWKESHETSMLHDVCNIDNNSYHGHDCSRLLNLINHKEGSEELYEFGVYPNTSSNLIYSKVANNVKSESSWLSNTLSESRKDMVCRYNNLIDRQNSISSIENSSSVPLTSYFKIPSTMFIEDHTEENKIVPNSMQICSPVVTACGSALALPPENVSTNDVAQTINSLIKGIMYRFRDVRLIINAEGKVSAALNASLSSLTSSELMILSEIIINAQKHVDTLGLKPGTCLNPNSSFSFIPHCPQYRKNIIEPNVSVTKETATSLNPNSHMSFSNPPLDVIQSRQDKEKFNTDKEISKKNTQSINSAPSPPHPVSSNYPCPNNYIYITDVNISDKTHINNNVPTSFISNSADSFIHSKDNYNSNVPKHNLKKNINVKKNKDIQQSCDVRAKSKTLLNFSKIICQKKKDYNNSFRTYVNHRTDLTPKITNVFSLCNNSSSMFSNILEIKETEDISNINEDIDIKSNPNLIKNMCLKEIEESLSILDSESELTESAPKPKKSRRRKKEDGSNMNLAKIRVKTASEISLSSNVDSNSVLDSQDKTSAKIPKQEVILHN